MRGAPTAERIGRSSSSLVDRIERSNTAVMNKFVKQIIADAKRVRKQKTTRKAKSEFDKMSPEQKKSVARSIRKNERKSFQRFAGKTELVRNMKRIEDQTGTTGEKFGVPKERVDRDTYVRKRRGEKASSARASQAGTQRSKRGSKASRWAASDKNVAKAKARTRAGKLSNMSGSDAFKALEGSSKKLGNLAKENPFEKETISKKQSLLDKAKKVIRRKGMSSAKRLLSIGVPGPEDLIDMLYRGAEIRTRRKYDKKHGKGAYQKLMNKRQLEQRMREIQKYQKST